MKLKINQIAELQKEIKKYYKNKIKDCTAKADELVLLSLLNRVLDVFTDLKTMIRAGKVFTTHLQAFWNETKQK